MRWLFLLLLLPFGQARGEGVRRQVEDFTASAKKTLELRLGRFDDAALRLSALGAARGGAKVRLILDAAHKPSRLAAPGLRQAGLSLRWALKGGSRFGVADGRRVLLGSFDGSAQLLDSAQSFASMLDDKYLAAGFLRGFEKEWASLSEAPPQALALEDALEALPDPRELEPHIRPKRRKN